MKKFDILVISVIKAIRKREIVYTCTKRVFFNVTGMFEDLEIEEKFNPWDVKSIEDFRFYCCPECSTRNVHKSDFIRHAVTFHPRSQIIIEKLENSKEDEEEDVYEGTKTISESHSEKEGDTDFSDSEIDLSDSEISFSDSEVEESSITDVSTLPDSNLPAIQDSFSINANTEQPMTLQTKENKLRVHNCNQCEKSYSTKAILIEHIEKVHENVRHNCDQCGKSFSGKSSLRRHIRHEHENVQFKCEQCDRSFYDTSHLKSHIKSAHDNIRYDCDKCGKSYTRKADLKRHIKSVHENFRYNCENCDETFSWKTDLYKHIKSAHNKKQENQDSLSINANN